MADRNVLQAAGDFDLDGALIIGSSGRRINIIDQLRELNIYQSIDAPFMSGNIVLADSAGVAELLPILGQERLLFSLKTPGHRESVSFNDYHAIIYNVEKRFQSTDREQVLIVNWTTLEHYKNLRTKISRSFDGNISTIVAEMLTSDNFLGSKKPLHIDQTKNIRKFVIPNLNPFQAINLLKEEAISSDMSPHFLFFENPDGIHFRSLDSLIGSQGSLNVPHKNTYKSQPPEDPKDIEAALGTILHWEVDDNSNNFLNVKLGMMSSTLYYHDIFNKNIQKFDYDYNDTFKKRNSTNQENKKSGTLIPQAKMGEKIITEYANSKIFVHPTASEKLHSVGTDNNAEEWLQESISRELQRDYFTLKIETYGDTNIMAGDLIHVIIPSNRPLGGSGGQNQMDPILSGRYLVTSLKHQVTPSESMHSMVMTVMKDSLETAAPVQETTFPDPRPGRKDVGLKITKQKMKPKTKYPSTGPGGKSGGSSKPGNLS